MGQRADGVRVAYPLFQAGGGGSTPTSALQLWYRPVELETAVELNRAWHSALPVVRNVWGAVCYVAEFDGVFYATALWTRPINRSLPVKTWLELRRLAVAPDAPRNTASRMLAWMARDIARTRPEVVRLISYQDVERHTGGIYRAAGWVRGDQRAQAGKRWNHKTRSRNPDQSVSAKVRWEKHLRGD